MTEMTRSQQLLADYVSSGSERAFHELVTRYMDLVYATALRLVNGDAHRAEDVAQTVFVDLAHQARRLSAESTVGGWLHRHTCFVASKVMRGERRRSKPSFPLQRLRPRKSATSLSLSIQGRRV
jgi:DNA-directed RNA polymerase specialized sigma24 family protein